MFSKISKFYFSFQPKVMSGVQVKKEPKYVFGERSEIKARSGFDTFFHGHLMEGAEIKNYSYVAIQATEPDFQKIEELYGISYSYKIKDYYVFMFKSYVSKDIYIQVSEALEFAVQGTNKLGLPYADEKDFEKGPHEYLTDVTELISFKRRLAYQQTNTIKDVSKANYVAVTEGLRGFQKDYILGKCGHQLDDNGIIDSTEGWFLDSRYGIVVDITGMSRPCGDMFDFILSQRNHKQNEALLFIKNNFDIHSIETEDSLESDVSISQDENDGVKVERGVGFILGTHGKYLTTGDEPKIISDFYVRVYNQILNKDGTIDFIVRLFNSETGKSTEKITYKHTSAGSQFKDGLSKYGNYHFFGTVDQINSLHSAICSCDVPVIKQVIGIGKQDDVLILGNGVFNFNTKKLTLFQTEEKFIFDDQKQGYFPTTPVGASVFKTFPKGHLHNFDDSGETVTPEEQIELFKEMYNNHLGDTALVYLWGLLGHMTFYSSDLNLPFWFAYGVRGSGKTELSFLFQRVFGMRKEGAQNFGNITQFVATNLFSSFRGLPIFLSENRVGSDPKANENRLNKLRSMYDKTSESKGKANQEVVTYNYTATAIMEGEESFNDSALRSRCVMNYVTKANHIPKERGGFEKFEELSKSPIISKMLLSYVKNVTYDETEYERYYYEGIKLLSSKTEDRCTKNMARLYAGCMIYAPKNQEFILESLIRIRDSQDKDLLENTPLMEFIKKVGFYINNINNGYVVANKGIILNLPKIEEYFRTKRIRLSLEFETYLGYLRDNGWEDVFHEDEWGMITGTHIPFDSRFPRALLCIKEANAFFKNNTGITPK